MGCDPDNSLAVLDDVADRRLLAALVKLRLWSRASRKPFVEVCWRLARRSTIAGIAAVIDGRTAQTLAEGQDLLSPRLRSLVRSEDTTLARALSSVRASNRDTAAMVLAYAVGSELNKPQAPPSIVYAYPFAHRPLVEFMLAIPGEELSAPGQTRSLMRRAFDGLVPPRILDRTSKGHYPPSTIRALQPVAAAMLPVDRLETVRRGWLDAGQLDAALRRLLGSGGSIGSVRQVIRLEQWLALRNRRAPAVIPQRKEVTCHEVFNA